MLRMLEYATGAGIIICVLAIYGYYWLLLADKTGLFIGSILWCAGLIIPVAIITNDATNPSTLGNIIALGWFIMLLLLNPIFGGLFFAILPCLLELEIFRRIFSFLPTQSHTLAMIIILLLSYPLSTLCEKIVAPLLDLLSGDKKLSVDFIFFFISVILSVLWIVFVFL